MDTLSRDSNSSGSILPLVGVIAGGLALVLSIVALVKLTSVQKTISAHDAEVDAKVTTVENEVRAASTKLDTELGGLRKGIQGALDQVGTTIGALGDRITKVEEAQKAKPVAAAKGGAGGAAAVATGVVDANGNYTIAPGDTLAKIARKFATKLDSIEAENPGLDPAKLVPGKKIKIPRK